MLQTAIDDCIHRAHRREGVDAEEWIFAGRSTSPLPFPLVCDVFDIDPEGLRRRIRPWQTLRRRPGRLTDALE